MIFSRRELVYLIAEIAGAAIGAALGLVYVGTPIAIIAGAALGPVIPWAVAIPDKFSRTEKIKRQILKSLDILQPQEVRDIIQAHGYEVPLGDINEEHPYVKVLGEYVKAISTLQVEGMVAVTEDLSYGYFHPSSSCYWVNRWSGNRVSKL